MRVVFIGTGAIGVPTLRALHHSSHQIAAVVTQPDKPVGREQRIEEPPVKRELQGLNIPIHQPRRIKDQAAIQQIRDLDAEVILVMAYGQILPSGVLTAPRLACLNLHASLLPRWRGAAPIQAAIAAGDSRTGITVMYVDEGLDTGDILLHESVTISSTDTAGSLHDRLAALAPAAALNALELIATGKAPRIRQNAAEATYAPKLTRESGRIDWSEPAVVIERRIRAFNPWPGAFTEIDGAPHGSRKLKIFSAFITNDTAKPAQILHNKEQLVIGTADGAIALNEVQLEGRKRMSAADFMRGNQWIKEVTAVAHSTEQSPPRATGS